ncbi:MAG TPA: hypothetical protein PKD63_13755 [Solirubrobacteraceae bacterium]|jgi:hypothetical protein|nr:hypothetical protein [Solirubrobacteraceae bacterium]
MEAAGDHRVWLRRLRWRVRGAWAAPAFVLFTVADAVLLARLPFAGDRGSGAAGALLAAAFLNLAMIAVAGPLIGLWLRRRDPGLPPFAARDRGSVWALGGLCALLVVGGLAHRPAVRDEEGALRAQAIAARDHFATQAPPQYRRNLGRMDTWKAGPDLYRTCVPGPDPSRSLCVMVTTDQSPPGVTRDRSQEPNRVLAGPTGDIVLIR